MLRLLVINTLSSSPAISKLRRLLLKAVSVNNLPTPPALEFRSPRRNIAITFGTEKLEWCGYTTVKKVLKICLFVSTEYTNEKDEQTDRQTDRRTTHYGIGRAYV